MANNYNDILYLTKKSNIEKIGLNINSATNLH